MIKYNSALITFILLSAVLPFISNITEAKDNINYYILYKGNTEIPGKDVQGEIFIDCFGDSHIIEEDDIIRRVNEPCDPPNGNSLISDSRSNELPDDILSSTVTAVDLQGQWKTKIINSKAVPIIVKDAIATLTDKPFFINAIQENDKKDKFTIVEDGTAIAQGEIHKKEVHFEINNVDLIIAFSGHAESEKMVGVITIFETLLGKESETILAIEASKIGGEYNNGVQQKD